MRMTLARTGGVGMHWEPYPVETTAYAALALMAAQRPEALAAIAFLYASRGSLGGFGSTQDTVMAFRALTRAALDARRDVNGAIDLVVDGAAAHTFQVNALNYDLLQSHTMAAGARSGPDGRRPGLRALKRPRRSASDAYLQRPRRCAGGVARRTACRFAAVCQATEWRLRSADSRGWEHACNGAEKPPSPRGGKRRTYARTCLCVTWRYL